MALCLISPSIQKALSIMDLKGVIDRLGDEFLSRHSLSPQASPQDDDIPHPLKVNNFAAGLDVGQISGKKDLIQYILCSSYRVYQSKNLHF